MAVSQRYSHWRPVLVEPLLRVHWLLLKSAGWPGSKSPRPPDGGFFALVDPGTKGARRSERPLEFKSGDFGSTGIHLVAGPTSAICIAALVFT